jgi:hypothetical protein
MIEPKTIAEQLMYSTVRISTSTGRGTGFFFNFPFDDKQVVPAIITNKHVIRGSNNQTFLLHTCNPGAGEKSPSGNFQVSLNGGLGNGWIEHPDANIDLCALPIAQVQQALPPPTQPFYVPLSGVPTEVDLKGLDAVQQVVMIGYPNGLWDHVNNLPLIRRGITATHPGVEYMIEGQPGPGVTVIDMACFPGSSGSPVFVYDHGTYAVKDGSTHVGTRAIFLGVLFGGPVRLQDGKIVPRTIPTATVPVAEMQMMINLGYVIKPKHVITLGKHLYSLKGMTYPE